MESRSLRFAAAARTLGDAARRAGFVAPTFRSPPKIAGRTRTIRRHQNGGATVSLVVKSRPWFAVVSDMIEGFVAVNRTGNAVDDLVMGERLRDALWDVVEVVDVRTDDAPTAGKKRGTNNDGSPHLNVVPTAA